MSDRMDWEQKADALNFLSPIAIMTRGPGDWYVSQRTEIGGNGFLDGAYGNGASPKEAIEDHWRKLVDELPPARFVVIHAGDKDRRQHLRWAGYMWRQLPLPTGGGK